MSITSIKNQNIKVENDSRQSNLISRIPEGVFVSYATI